MRVALSSYRSKPHSGGQGIYVRNLSRELVRLGHEVEVFSGQPYPELDPGVRLTRLPSLDLYRDDDPFRRPGLREFRDRIDVAEFLTMCASGFPEPRTFSWRLARELRGRLGEFDVLHDNQTLGPGVLELAGAGCRPSRPSTTRSPATGGSSWPRPAGCNASPSAGGTPSSPCSAASPSARPTCSR